MAKVPYSKIKQKVESKTSIIEFNGEKIEVQEYIPLQEKLSFMEEVINKVLIESPYYTNYFQVEAICLIDFIEKFTNITFTEKQKENIAKLYDEIRLGGLEDLICKNSDYDLICGNIFSQLDAIYAYKNSMASWSEENMNPDTAEWESKARGILTDLTNKDNYAEIQNILDYLASTNKND